MTSGQRQPRRYLSDLGRAVRSWRREGMSATLLRASLARERRGHRTVEDRAPLVPPSSPLAWRATLSEIRRHYRLAIPAGVAWGEDEMLRDTQRIAALGWPGSGADPAAAAVILSAAGEVRHVLASLEALRSWPDSRRLAVQVVGPLPLAARGALGSLPEVTVVDPGDEPLTGHLPTLRLQAGDLPHPGWASGLLHRLRRPGVDAAVDNPELDRRPALGGPWTRVRGAPVSRGLSPRSALPVPGERVDVAPDAGVTALHRPAGANRDVRPHRRARRLLVVASAVPRPDQDSGSEDTYWLVRHASEAGLDVALVTAEPRSGDGRYAWLLRREGVRVAPVPSGEQLGRWAAEADAVVGVGTAAAWASRSAVAGRRPHPPLLYVPLDLTHLAMRDLERLRPGLDVGVTAAQLQDQELALVSECALTAVISEDEATYLRSLGLGERVVVLPMLRTDPRRDAPGGEPTEGRVVFVGGLKHPPNQVALEWFIGDVWPQVRERAPDAEFEVWGSNFGVARPERWAGAQGVRLMGRYVRPEDPYRADAVAVAPLPYGGGVKGKVVTALGHAVPVVGTPAAVAGLPPDVRDCVLVADAAPDLAATLAGLLRSPSRRRALGDRGAAAYDRHYSQEAGREHVRLVLEQVIGGDSLTS